MKAPLTAETIKQILRRHKGTLAETPLPALFYVYALEETTLALEIKRHQFYKKIFFENGVIVECKSNLLHESLGKFLVDKGKLKEEQAHKALAISAKKHVALSEALIKLKLISAFELFKILQQSLAHKLLDAFTWQDGEFTATFDKFEIDSPLKVKVPQLILTGATRFTHDEVIAQGIEELRESELALHPLPALSTGGLKFNAKQTQLITLFRKYPKIDELFSGSRLEPEEIERFVYAMAILGAVIPKDEMPEEKPATPEPLAAEVIEAKEEPPEKVEPKIDIEKLRNEITEKYLVYRKQDAFDLLEIKDNTTLQVIKQGYFEFSEKYAPWQFKNEELKSLAEKAQDLFIAGSKAYILLTDSDERNSLVYKRQNPEEKQKGDPDAFFIETDLLDAQQQFHKGQLHMAAGEYKDAINFLEFASDCDSRNSLYRAELAYCRYLENKSHATDSLRELHNAIRMDPECGVAYFYGGEISVAIKDLKGAEVYYRHANKHLQGDRRPVEALKKLSNSLK